MGLRYKPFSLLISRQKREKHIYGFLIKTGNCPNLCKAVGSQKPSEHDQIRMRQPLIVIAALCHINL